MDGGLNPKWVIGSIAIGAVFVWAAVVESDDNSDVYSSVLVEVGVGIALVSIIVWLEQKFVRGVAAGVAREVAEEVGNSTDERITRLEDLASSEQEARSGAVRMREAQLDNLFQDGLTAESLGKALLSAATNNVLGKDFGVRTGDTSDSPVLYPLVQSHNGEVDLIYFGFRKWTVSGETFTIHDKEVPVPDAQPSVTWTKDQPAEEIAVKLEEVLRSANIPTSDFSLTCAIGRLRDSIRVAERARDAKGGSGKRLEGALVLLVNDDWVLTDSGIESISSDRLISPLRVQVSGTGKTRTVLEFAFDREEIDSDPSLAGVPEFLRNNGFRTSIHSSGDQRRASIANRIRELD